MTNYEAQWSFNHVEWRNLTWGEFRTFQQRYNERRFESPMDIFNDVYRTVLIDGPELKYASAGIVDWIGRQQLETNPFSGEPKLLIEAQGLGRAIVNSSELHYARGVVAAVLHYKLEEIDQWDPTMFFTRLALAEQVLGKPIPLVRQDPDAKPKPKPKQKGKP